MTQARPTLALGVLLLVAALAAFFPVLALPFVDLDDAQYVSENPEVLSGLSSAGLRWAFTTGKTGNWHPLTWISLQLDATLFGTSPAGFHRTNLLLHAANAVLLFLFLRRLTGQLVPSAIAAALFALHPLRVESVAWVSARKDVLSGLFWMLALWAFACYRERPGRARLVALALAFLGGLASKPTVVTLPFVLLLVDRWVGSTALRRRVVELLPLFGLSAVFCLVTLGVQEHAMASDVPASIRLANAAVAYGSYLWKTISPLDLAPFYPYPVEGPTLGKLLASAATLTCISAFVWWARDRRYLPVGWLWFLGTLVPMIGLVQVGHQHLADRYTYLPSIGLAILLAWGLADLARKRLPLQLAAGVSAALVCAVLTYRQVHVWSDDVTLWQQTLRATDNDNAVAHAYLGQALWKRGREREAEAQFQQALQAGGSDLVVLSAYGRLLLQSGRFDHALRLFHEAVEIAPDDAATRINHGLALYERGQVERAIEQYEAGLQLDPRNAQAHFNLGLAWIRQGEPSAAEPHMRQAVDLQPATARYRAGLGYALARLDRSEEAAASYAASSRLDPEWVNTYNRAAQAMAASRDSLQRNGPRAVEMAEQVCDATGWSDPRHLDTLAAAYAEFGRFEDAVTTARRAVALLEEQQLSAELPGALARLALYERGQPLRITARAGSR